MAGIGSSSWFSIMDDATWGQADGGGAEMYSRMYSETMQNDEGITSLTSVLSDAPGIARIVTGFNRVAGAVDPEVLFEGPTWVLLAHAFGASSVNSQSQASGTWYLHDYTLKTALTPGFTMEVSKGDVPTNQVFLYKGCMVNEIEFRFEPEDLVRCTANIIAKDETPGTARSGAPSYPADQPAYWWYLDTSTFSLAGTTISPKSAAIRINNNLADDRFLMSKTISQPIRNGKREVTGQVVAEFADLTHYNKIANETEGSLAITVTSTVDIVGSSPTQVYEFSFASSYCRLTGSTPTVQDDGIVEVTFDFICRSPGGNDELTAQLKNDMSAISA